MATTLPWQCAASPPGQWACGHASARAPALGGTPRSGCPPRSRPTGRYPAPRPQPAKHTAHYHSQTWQADLAHLGWTDMLSPTELHPDGQWGPEPALVVSSASCWRLVTSNSLRPVVLLICVHVREVGCNIPSPMGTLPDFRSLQQNSKRDTHCSAACTGPSVLSSRGRAPVALAAAAGRRLVSLFAPAAVPLCTSATRALGMLPMPSS